MCYRNAVYTKLRCLEMLYCKSIYGSYMWILVTCSTDTDSCAPFSKNMAFYKLNVAARLPYWLICNRALRW